MELLITWRLRCSTDRGMAQSLTSGPWDASCEFFLLILTLLCSVMCTLELYIFVISVRTDEVIALIQEGHVQFEALFLFGCLGFLH